MVREQIARVRLILALHFAVLAFLTAMLVASGSGSIVLPLLVLVVGVASFLFVDWLEWFSLHHWLAYLGMLLGTMLALYDYFSVDLAGGQARKLYAIASLLIYPELVLMMQRKSMRLFEQMAIFLLLEIIVAALINDDVLFGVLLAPIVVLWVSSLLLLTRYTAMIQLHPDLDRPAPRFVEVLMEQWKRLQTRPQASRKSMFQAAPGARQYTRPVGWSLLLGQAAPIGIVSLTFAGMYFYLLPRTTSDRAPPFSLSPRTGFAEEMTFGSMGRLLQDTTPVMQLTLADDRTGRPYPLFEPPYIRGTVVSDYLHDEREARVRETTTEPGRNFPTRLKSLSAAYESGPPMGDVVRMRIELRGLGSAVLPSIAPMFAAQSTARYVSLMPFDWRLFNSAASGPPRNAKLSYELITTAFRDGIDPGLIPDSQTFYSLPERTAAIAARRRLGSLSSAHGDYQRTQWIDDLVARAALGGRFREQNPVAFAQALAMYFSNSGEFTYSLDLTYPQDKDLDPIEDFVVHQKRGHCQYFAAALMLTLRRQQIPARVVLGFHPLEYNAIGRYFNVRNSDAHAWVEAYFTRRELAAAGMDLLGADCEGAWLRLDPTPAGEGSNAGNELQPQSGQAVDYAQRLWNEYILDGRSVANRGALYQPIQESTRETYVRLMQEFRSLMKQMREQQFTGGALTSSHGVVWPFVLLLVLIAGASLVCWQLLRWLPRLAPRLAKRLGWLSADEGVRQLYFRACLNYLRKAGFRRLEHQTPSEHTSQAARSLQQSQKWAAAPEHLDRLTQAYYAQRFGNARNLPDSEVKLLMQSLEQLEKHVR
jgi:protein-glutamine gamma-glutamyltransferase